MSSSVKNSVARTRECENREDERSCKKWGENAAYSGSTLGWYVRGTFPHLPRLCGRACASHVAATHSIVYQTDRTDTAPSRRDPVKAHQLSSRLLGPWYSGPVPNSLREAGRRRPPVPTAAGAACIFISSVQPLPPLDVVVITTATSMLLLDWSRVQYANPWARRSSVDPWWLACELLLLLLFLPGVKWHRIG